VVVAAVMVLAAILVPTVGRGHPPAHRTVCLSNAKQIGLGIAIFENEHEAMPASPVNGVLRTGAGKNGADTGIEWGLYALWDMGNGVLNDPQIFLCPNADPKTKPGAAERLVAGNPMGFSGQIELAGDHKQSSYSMTFGLEVRDPANKVVAGDKLRGSSADVVKQAWNGNDEYSFVAAGARRPFDSRSALMNSISGNHRTEGANLLFMGGNARWYAVNDLGTGAWSAGAPPDGSENKMRRQTIYALEGDAESQSGDDTWMQ
jgi:hypothetical protein